jgi:hypothetical protein
LGRGEKRWGQQARMQHWCGQRETRGQRGGSERNEQQAQEEPTVDAAVDGGI